MSPNTELPTNSRLVVPPGRVREKLGMSQEEFWDALRVPVETVREWEQQGDVMHFDPDPLTKEHRSILTFPP